MSVHYLEIVTGDIDAVRQTYERIHGLTFAPAEPALGQARVASLGDGGLLGIRAPLTDVEQPIVRFYVRVDDVDEAAREAAASGATVALSPTPLEGHGRIAIFIQGGIEHGVWQV